MGKPFPFFFLLPFFFFFFFFFFLGLTSAIGRADVSSEHWSRAGQVTRGSGHARVGSHTGRGAWFRGQKNAGSFTGAWRRVRRFPASIFLVEIRLDETKPWMSLKR
jgi:hypothetical protein